MGRLADAVVLLRYRFVLTLTGSVPGLIPPRALVTPPPPSHPRVRARLGGWVSDRGVGVGKWTVQQERDVGTRARSSNPGR